MQQKTTAELLMLIAQNAQHAAQLLQADATLESEKLSDNKLTFLSLISALEEDVDEVIAKHKVALDACTVSIERAA